MMLLAALFFVWAGLVLGISFLETPVKFTAPSLTLPVGLDVGRHVFGMLNKVEIAGSLLVCGLLLLTGVRTPVLWAAAIAVFVIVAVQTAWLLPVLDARVSVFLHGETPPRTPHHVVFIVLEFVKVVCLLTAGTACLSLLKVTAAAVATAAAVR